MEEKKAREALVKKEDAPAKNEAAVRQVTVAEDTAKIIKELEKLYRQVSTNIDFLNDYWFAKHKLAGKKHAVKNVDFWSHTDEQLPKSILEDPNSLSAAELSRILIYVKYPYERFLAELAVHEGVIADPQQRQQLDHYKKELDNKLKNLNDCQKVFNDKRQHQYDQILEGYKKDFGEDKIPRSLMEKLAKLMGALQTNALSHEVDPAIIERYNNQLEKYQKSRTGLLTIIAFDTALTQQKKDVAALAADLFRNLGTYEQLNAAVDLFKEWNKELEQARQKKYTLGRKSGLERILIGIQDDILKQQPNIDKTEMRPD